MMRSSFLCEVTLFLCNKIEFTTIERIPSQPRGQIIEMNFNFCVGLFLSVYIAVKWNQLVKWRTFCLDKLKGISLSAEGKR